MPRPTALQTVLTTALALVAFAANSVLARLALVEGTTDPASFTAVRLATGAAVLTLLVRLVDRRAPALPGSSPKGDFLSASMLWLYATAFSWAYVQLATGTGALILFGSVQITMLGAALLGGERPSPREALGWVAAASGLLYLVSPGVASPALGASLLMTAAGFGWGIYSLRGRSASEPLCATADNFRRTLPLTALATVVFLKGGFELTLEGFVLAALSGGVTSGVGYAVWYRALRGLTATRAATAQLTVPALAALGGVALLAEPITLRLLIASLLVLGGVGYSLSARPAQ